MYEKRTAVGILRRAGLGLLLLSGGCGGGENEPLPPEPADRCPAPGAGVSVGGSFREGDTPATPTRRLVLMGGGPEDDAAATLFAEAAGGGDVVVLRATGSLTSYPDYFSSGLSPSPRPASVVTVRTDTPGAGADPAVLCHLRRAEAVWLAGGDQWSYLGGWPAALGDTLAALTARGRALGGTSAGAMSLGEAAFDARHGSVTSPEALADPLRSLVSLSFPSFFQPELSGTLVESHFTERDREGRLLVFLARFLTEKVRSAVVGIALDEGVALVLQGGSYRVLGPAGRGAWLYRVTGPAGLQAGAPLELSGIRRVRLEPGSQGGWPFDFDAAGGQALQVRGGVVGTS